MGTRPGKKLYYRSLPVLFAHNFSVSVARFPDKQDPADIASSNPSLYKTILESSTDYVTHRLRQLRDDGITTNKIERILESGNISIASYIIESYHH